MVKRRTAHTNTCTRTIIKRHTDTKPHAHMYTRCCCFWEQQFYCCCFAHQRLDDLRSRRFAKLCTLFVCKYASHLRCMYICFQLPFVKLIACISFIAAYSLFFHQTTHKFSHKMRHSLQRAHYAYRPIVLIFRQKTFSIFCS